MRRFLVVLMLLILATGAFAQTTGLQSIQSDVSFGVFGNALDGALTVQEAGNRPAFSELMNKMVFGGLSNLNWQSSANGIQVDETFASSIGGDPLWIGYFKPGDMPYSVFWGNHTETETGNQADITNVTTTAKNGIVSGTTTTNYDWISQEEVVDYTGNRLTSWSENWVQFLTSLNGMNVGAGVQVFLVDNSVQGNNYELTQTNYYDTAAGTEAPSPSVDYTFTETQTELDKITYFALDVPFFMRTGDLGHTAQLFTSFQFDNASYSLAQTYTAPEDGGFATTVTEADDGTIKSTIVNVNASYELVAPAFFGEHEENEFIGGVALASTPVRSAQYSEVLTEQDKTFPGGGGAATDGARNDDETTSTISSQMDYGLDLTASHSFYYDIGDAVRVGLVPDALAGIFVDNEDWILESRTDVDRQDTNADGTFDAADTIVTTTTTYTNTSLNDRADITTTADVVNEFDITAELGLAGAIEVTPGDWPFSVTLGSRPRARLVSTKITTLQAQTATTVETADGAGTVASTTVNEAPASDEEVVWDHVFTMDAAHRIGLNMLVGEMVRFDVALGFNTNETNILDFSNFTLQAIVELP